MTRKDVVLATVQVTNTEDSPTRRQKYSASPWHRAGIAMAATAGRDVVTDMATDRQQLWGEPVPHHDGPR
jgi:hypothetical protein